LPPLVALYEGFASKEKLGIQIWQDPTAPKNSQIYILEVGVGLEQTVSFLSVPRFVGPG
jgi:hypothetical protein